MPRAFRHTAESRMLPRSALRCGEGSHPPNLQPVNPTYMWFFPASQETQSLADDGLPVTRRETDQGRGGRLHATDKERNLALLGCALGRFRCAIIPAARRVCSTVPRASADGRGTAAGTGPAGSVDQLRGSGISTPSAFTIAETARSQILTCQFSRPVGCVTAAVPCNLPDSRPHGRWALGF